MAFTLDKNFKIYSGSVEYSIYKYLKKTTLKSTIKNCKDTREMVENDFSVYFLKIIKN